MSAVVLLVVGCVLCFLGARSLRLGVLAAGFGATWLVADAVNAETGTALLVSTAGAVLAFLVTLLASRLLMFVGGLCVGAVVGARLLVLLTAGTDEGETWLLALVFVPAVALLCGYLTSQFKDRFLAWGTAFAGAALMVAGIGRIGADSTDELWRPQTTAGAIVFGLLWVALTGFGHRVQHRRARAGQEDGHSRVGR